MSIAILTNFYSKIDAFTKTGHCRKGWPEFFNKTFIFIGVVFIYNALYKNHTNKYEKVLLKNSEPPYSDDTSLNFISNDVYIHW